MDYYDIPSQDTGFSRLIDSLVLVVLGIAIGIVISQLLLTSVDITTVSTPSKVKMQNELTSPSSNTEGVVDLPQGVRLEEN